MTKKNTSLKPRKPFKIKKPSKKWVRRGVATAAVIALGASAYFIRNCTRDDADTSVPPVSIPMPDTTYHTLSPGDSIGIVDDYSGNIYSVKAEPCPQVPKPKTSYKPRAKAPRPKPVVVKDTACEERLERVIELNQEMKKENDSLVIVTRTTPQNNMYEAIGVDFGFNPDSCGIPLDDCGKPITEVNKYE